MNRQQRRIVLRFAAVSVLGSAGSASADQALIGRYQVVATAGGNRGRPRSW